MAAKRARRKKREREKGRKKGEGEGEVNGDDALTGQTEDGDDIKWEDRVQSWCVIGANAKVKSFALASEEPNSKVVSVSLHLTR